MQVSSLSRFIDTSYETFFAERMYTSLREYFELQKYFALNLQSRKHEQMSIHERDYVDLFRTRGLLCRQSAL